MQKLTMVVMLVLYHHTGMKIVIHDTAGHTLILGKHVRVIPRFTVKAQDGLARKLNKVCQKQNNEVQQATSCRL